MNSVWMSGALGATLAAVLALVVFGSALGLLVWDRHRTPTPSAAADRASLHGALTAAVGVVCLFGGLVAAFALAIGVSFSGQGRLVGLFPAVVGLAFLAAYAVGELTWPRPQGVEREAALLARTVDDVAPHWLRRLLWFWAAAIVLALIVFGTMASGPREISRVTSTGQTLSNGPFPGWWFGVPLLIATVVLLVGAEAVLRLVAVRPAVTGVTRVWDMGMRRRSARRLLRGVQVVLAFTLAGLLAVAGAMLNRLGYGRAVGYGTDAVVSQGYLAAGTTLLTAAAACFVVGTLVAVFPGRDVLPRLSSSAAVEVGGRAAA